MNNARASLPAKGGSLGANPVRPTGPGEHASLRSKIRAARAITRPLQKTRAIVPLSWPDAWWRVTRMLLVRGESMTAGTVLRLAMRLVGIHERDEEWVEEIGELARVVSLDAAHVAALLDDTAHVDAETAAILFDRTTVPVSFWLELKRQ